MKLFHTSERKPPRSRLQNKAMVSASILCFISVVVSLVLYYGICSRLLQSRAEELDSMFMQTAVDRTNRYLGEIAEIVNLSLSDKSLETMLLSSPEDMQQYPYISAQKDYEKHLRSIILSYGQVENFVFYGEGGSFAIQEHSGDSYRRQVRDFYRNILPDMAGKGARQFFLINLIGSRKNGIAILSPVFRAGLEEPVGCVAAVLSEQFSTQLQFAGDQIYIVDQLGNASFLKGGTNSLSGQKLLEKALIFSDWKLVSASFGNTIEKSFSESLWVFLLAGVGYLAAAALFAYWFSGRLISPLREMDRSLKKLADRQEARNHGDYRVTPVKRRLHFKNRLMVFYLVLATIPVVASSVGFYFVTQSTFDQKIGYFSEHRTNFLFDQLELTNKKYQRSAVELAYNSDIQGYMLKASSSDEGAEALESMVSRLLLQKQTQEQGIMNISLFGMDGKLQYASFYSRHFIDYDRYEQLIRLMEEDSYRSYWSAAYPSSFNKDCITIALTMFSMPPIAGPGQRLGYLFLDLDASELEGMISDFSSLGKANVYLFDEGGLPVFSSHADASREALFQTGAPGGENSEAGGQGKQNVLFETTLTDSHWTAVAEIPREEYLRERNSILITCAGIILLLLFLCLFFSYFSSMALSKGLDSLGRFVKAIDSVRFKERFHSSTGDEIEGLGESFNEMLDTLDRLIDEQQRAQTQLRDSKLAAKQFELNLLQSQINPHFLYNTLKTVQYMVHVGDLRAEKMIKLLIHLFRTGISKNERLVTIEEELKHVTTYLEIQQIRFSDKFKVELTAPSDGSSLYLLKLTLQPIVENAIYHGLELLDRNGTLSITVLAGKDLRVVVSDDGNGMSEERLTSIREKLEGNEKSESIGLYNVHQRIRLYFGKPYGITLESAPQQGTQVTIRFPRIENPDDFPIGG